MDEILNDFVIGNGIIVNTTGNEALESRDNGRHEDFEKIVERASQNKAPWSDTTESDAVENAVFAVENRIHDAVLTAVNNVVILQVEMAIQSITSSSGNGPNSIFQNPGRIDFIRNTANAPLRSASSRLDLNIEQDKID